MGFCCALVLIMAGFLLDTSIARADSIDIHVGSFRYWSPVWTVPFNGQYWSYYAADIVDQDPDTYGCQVTITASKPVEFIWYFYPDGTEPGFYSYDSVGRFIVNPVPASASPQKVTLALPYVQVIGTDEGWLTEAESTYGKGFYKFLYTDGTSSIVDSNMLGGAFGSSRRCNHTKDPVNTSTGNATYSFTDLSLAAKGGSLSFARTYNSQDCTTAGTLGAGWRSNYEASLEFPDTSTAVLAAADGKRETFTATSNGDYSSPSGSTERLHKNTDGTFTVTYLDQSHDEYDSNGRLVSLVDRYGNQRSLTYDANGQLTAVADGSGSSLKFSYESGRIVTAQAVTTAAGQDTVVSSVSYGYDSAGNLTSYTDANGHTTSYAYDSTNELVSIRQPKGSANPFVTNTYADGKVVSQADALGHTTTLAYDEGFTTVTDALGHATTDHWGLNYWLSSHTDALGHSGSIAYDSAGFAQSTTDANGHQTSYTHDALGNITSATDPVGNQTHATYDLSNGNLLTTTDAAGRTTTYTYDSTGKYLTSVTTPIASTGFAYNIDGTISSLTDALSHTTTYQYDSHGNLTSTTDAGGKTKTYGYDSAGRKTSITDANGNESQLAYSAKGNVLSIKSPLAITDPGHRHEVDFTYDANDNVSSSQDPNGNTTSYSYDDMNHPTSTHDALSGQASFGYDANYNLASTQDPNSNTTTYNYDANNRLTGITNPLSKTIGYSYDAVGNLTGITYPNGNQTTLAYDANNLLSGTSHSSDATTYAYTYNPTNTLAKVEKNNGGKAWTFTYDAGDRLKAETDKNDPTLGRLTIKRQYNKVSNLTGLDIGDACSLDFTYNARNLVTSLKDPGGTTTFAHDALGRLTKVVTPDASEKHYTYDADARPTRVKSVTTSGTQLFNYAYDSNGNVLSEDQTAYTYDALDRLASWHDPASGKTSTYSYDPAGNLTQVAQDGTTTQSYTYNAADEITNSGYTYDDNGNLTASGTRKYFYDADNQLVKVKEGATVLATMTYDYAGRRTSLTTASGTTYFHYSGGVLVAESDGTGALTATYAYTPGGSLISMTRGSSTYYYQTNAHGDVVSLTDSTGAVVATYSYDPWGNPTGTTGTVENPLRYTGYYYDSSTGLYYLWHRYYDPGTMRFLTHDCLGGKTDDTQSSDRYLYARDNPLRYCDPTGCGIIDDIEAIGTDIEVGALDVAGAAMIMSTAIPECEQDEEIGAAMIEDASALMDEEAAATAQAEAQAVEQGSYICSETGLSYDKKILDDMARRGWTEQSVSEVYEHPSETYKVWDLKNDIPATAYAKADNVYVVVNENGQIVQVSNTTKPNWKPVWNDPTFAPRR